MYYLKNKKVTRINLFLCLVIVFSLVLGTVSFSQVEAVRCDSYTGTTKKACSWCNNQKEHPAANDWGQYCINAYVWGYEHKSSAKCDKEYSASNEAFRKKWCKDGGVAQYKKDNSTSDSGGDDSGGGGDTDSTTTSPSIDNDAKDDEPSEDGIEILGAKINAGGFNLSADDAKKAGIDNKPAENILSGILNAVYGLTATIAVIVIIVAGIMYITSDGDPTRTQNAKRAIIYSAVGLVIVGSAFIITSVILGLVF